MTEALHIERKMRSEKHEAFHYCSTTCQPKQHHSNALNLSCPWTSSQRWAITRIVSVPSSERRVARFTSVHHCHCSDQVLSIHAVPIAIRCLSFRTLQSSWPQERISFQLREGYLAYVTHRQSHVVHVSTIASVAYLSQCYIRIRK